MHHDASAHEHDMDVLTWEVLGDRLVERARERPDDRLTLADFAPILARVQAIVRAERPHREATS